MKTSKAILGALFSLALPTEAAISIEVSAGYLLQSNSSVVDDTALWAIVYQAPNGSFPGGLTDNSSLTAADPTAVFNAFNGQSIVTGGMIGLNNKILWAGPVDGENTSGTPGVGSNNLATITFLDFGVDANGKFAIYWFPGLTTANSTLPLELGFQIGGLQSLQALTGGENSIGMQFPGTDTTGIDHSAAFLSEGELEGHIPADSFRAIIVPEPSTFTLSALGLAALLRRRRK